MAEQLTNISPKRLQPKRRTRAWMPMYWGDYLTDTPHLTTIEHGAYLLLIAAYWYNGGLPTEDRSLQRICKVTSYQWNKIKPVLAEFFDENWRHKRIDFELEKAGRIANQREELGAYAGRSRWGEITSGYTRSQRLAEARKLGTHTQAEWAAMTVLFGSKCLKCGNISDSIVKDHIVPIYQGGSDGLENLQPLCSGCNSSKGAEAIDYRPQDWHKRLTKLREMPTKTPTHSQSHLQEESKIEAAPQSERPKKEKRGSRLEKGWTPPQPRWEDCKREFGGDRANTILTKFRNHWLSKSGKDGVRSNWNLVWDNWLINERQWHGGNGNGTHRPQSAKDEWGERLRNLGRDGGESRADPFSLLPQREASGSGGVSGIGAGGFDELPFGTRAKGGLA